VVAWFQSFVVQEVVAQNGEQEARLRDKAEVGAGPETAMGMELEVCTVSKIRCI
jgi:hypothetical protein